ncbi:MAG: dCTP deaminase [Planctomycetota bacterium]|nr:MAG: dCTP deaminase [Planctomycetota bacterium]
MTILTREAILKEIEAGRIRIDPYDPARVGTASVDLTVSRYFRRFVGWKPIDLHEDVDYRDPSITQLVEVPPGECMEVLPKEMVLGITNERVGLPDDLCGWFDGRSRFARMGLLVHISAGFMQSGTHNNTVLEIFNMSPRVLRIHPGTPICQFIFQRTEGSQRHSGRFSGQTLAVFCGEEEGPPAP